MKHMYIPKRLAMLLILFFTANIVFAQKGGISGKVTDEKKQGILGATVQVEPGAKGAVTDIDGNYHVTGLKPGSYTVVFSYVGYLKQTKVVQVGDDVVSLNVQMAPNINTLQELVVIGYGVQKKSDLTGAVTPISSKDFVQGNIQTADQLIQGKVAGVQITSNGGAPGSGSTIRIRGGSSLNASNDPLIVVDGVPLDNGGISGSANALSLINPNDIENMTVLRDASATAIYGNRASNGVIIITTKKGSSGSSKLQVNFSSVNSVSTVKGFVPVLTGDQLRQAIADSGTANQKSLVGTANTNWQEEIYRLAMSTDNNLNFTGGVKNLPYRLSLGYTNQNGILKKSAMERYTMALNLNPTFLKNHLSVNANLKSSMTNNYFSDQGAIGAAVTFDPTRPVNSDTTLYGGYFEWLDNAKKPNTLSPRNPVGLLMQRDDYSTVYRTIANVQLEYKFHFMPELKAHMNVGGDFANSSGHIYVPAAAASNFLRKGVNNHYDQVKENQLFDFYFNYNKEYKSIKSRVDLTAGYSFQKWYTSSPAYPDLNVNLDTVNKAGVPFKTQNALLSLYGRLNYTFMDKYLFTVTLRQDGSSRFSPDTRYGLFPSMALAWRLKEEMFFKDWKALSNLKLRVGYGITGQQDIGSDFPYLGRYSYGDPTAQYQFGSTFYQIIRPEGYVANLKWETTTTQNFALDFGFFNGRISGSVDVYFKKTNDLLAVIPVAGGTNLTNQILQNVGNIENQGVEITLNTVPIAKKNLNLEIGANVTFNQNTVTKLSVNDAASNSAGILVGGISGGVGNTIQIHSVGYPTNSFYLYEQLYNENGKPIEGKYKDQNGDGKINEKDLVRKESPNPKMFFGFYANLSYKKWTVGAVLRGNVGNYVYNNVYSNMGHNASIDGTKSYINNASVSYLDTYFKRQQVLSDYYLQDASFLRVDNLSVGYNFGNVITKKSMLRASFYVQNAFVFTNYKGLDPEVPGGIDNNFYPRPRVYSLGLNFTF